MVNFPLEFDAPACVPPVWAPDGRLAVVTRAGLALLRPQAPEAHALLLPPEPLRTVVWSPGGERLAVADDGADRLRALAPDGSLLWSCAPNETALDELAWSPDSRLLAGLGDGVVVCDAATGAVRWRQLRTRYQTLAYVGPAGLTGARFVEDTLYPQELAWSPDGAWLAVRWADLLRVLRASDGHVQAEVPWPEPRRGEGACLRWGPVGEALFESGGQRLARCSLATRDGFARGFTFSDDGRLAVAEGAEHVLHVQDASGRRAVPGQPRTLTALAWSSRGELATGGRDAVLRRLSGPSWALTEWAQLPKQPEHLAWSPDGAWLVVACGPALLALPA